MAKENEDIVMDYIKDNSKKGELETSTHKIAKDIQLKKVTIVKRRTLSNVPASPQTINGILKKLSKKNLINLNQGSRSTKITIK